MVRDGKPKGFFYRFFDHRTVDGNLAIITDMFVDATPANVHDSIAAIWIVSTGNGSASVSTPRLSAWMPPVVMGR